MSDAFVAGAITERQHTFHGGDEWPGIVVSVVFGLAILILISLPVASWRRARWCLLLVLLAGVALLNTFLFRSIVESTSVEITPSANERVFYAPESYREVSQAAAAWVDQSLVNVPHKLSYRVGYYSAFGLSIAMLLLGATGIRHALAGAPKSVGSKRKQQLANVRFKQSLICFRT